MFELDGLPPTKARPRVGKGGHVYKPDAGAELATALQLRRAVPEPLQGNVCIVATFYLPNRNRRDFDNLIKHLCDAGNGILWADDSQVTGAAQIIELDRARPRTVVMLGSHDTSTLRR